MRAMKLFLTWLLGVPLLVIFMVTAQTLLMQDQEAQSRPRIGSQHCSGERDAHGVASLIPKQGYGVSCYRLTVQ
jgi:hypothetical protein